MSDSWAQKKPGTRPGFLFHDSRGLICTVPTVPIRIRLTQPMWSNSADLAGTHWNNILIDME
jgi:hypothetical protein